VAVQVAIGEVCVCVCVCVCVWQCSLHNLDDNGIQLCTLGSKALFLKWVLNYYSHPAITYSMPIKRPPPIV